MSQVRFPIWSLVLPCVVLLACGGGGGPSEPDPEDPPVGFDFSGSWENHIQLLNCDSGEIESEDSSSAIVCPGGIPGEIDSCEVSAKGTAIETHCIIRDDFSGIDCSLVTEVVIVSTFDDSSYTGTGQGVLRLDGTACGSPDSTVINCFDIVVWGAKLGPAPDPCEARPASSRSWFPGALRRGLLQHRRVAGGPTAP